MSATLIVAGAALGVWTYLIALRGRFWRCAERESQEPPPAPARWPAIAAIVPARNEADTIAHSLAALLAQDYPAPFAIVVVDDGSEDGTAEIARSLGARDRLTVLRGAPLPAGWTGKLWAVQQGLDHVAAAGQPPKYVLLTDADIVHAPHALRRLVVRAEAGGLLLTSRMVRLRCASLPERALIPAFVFFFQMLYPFAWVNRPQHPCAAAAGGCMLIERNGLAACGGVAPVRAALIDDCALAAMLKARGPIWLGLTDCAASIRAYPRFGDIRRMVVRSAYAQLSYSPPRLLLALSALGLTFLAPPLIAFGGSGSARLAAIIAWALMALAYWPTLRFYRLAPLWAPLLPVVAAAYMLLTADSAYQHLRRRGGMWKGRAQALPAKGP
jgi:hopene-associated glycosyltransferase HpnB